jgi:hypothetical protein
MKSKSGLIEDIWSYIAFALMLIGISGVSWDVFQEDGLAKRFFGAVWDAETRNPLLFTPIILGGAFLVVLFFRGGFKVGQGNPFSDLFVYILMAAGVYYGYKFLS